MLTGWGVENYCRESIIFKATRKVKIYGFLWGQHSYNQERKLAMKFALTIDENEESEWYEMAEQSSQDYIQVDQP